MLGLLELKLRCLSPKTKTLILDLFDTGSYMVLQRCDTSLNDSL